MHQVGNASLASCHARSRLDPLPKRRLSCRRGGLCCSCLAPVPHSQIPSGRTKDQLNPRPNRRARVKGRRRPLLATICPGAVLQRRFLHQIQIYQYHILDPFQQGVSSATPSTSKLLLQFAGFILRLRWDRNRHIRRLCLLSVHLQYPIPLRTRTALPVPNRLAPQV